MSFVADFHIHSPYSRATSPKLNPEGLDYWSRLKGIKVIGTGDFTHPAWLEELKTKLEPAEAGLYKLKAEYRQPLAGNFDENVRFILTAEISNIYKKNGKVRKIHNVVFAPSFAVAEKIQQILQSYNFNITSDGRPILGLDARDLLEICLEASPEIFFVPAHIWTPWFSLLGSKSGFDSVEECFEDLSEHIYALETGLSSDPPMNYMCSFLDKYTLISNSDAHSPEKLGREANLFNTELSYAALIKAMKLGSSDEFLGTIEFYPEEGKYHYDGHRKCEVCFDPVETLKHQGICPQCHKPVVIGVSNRVAELADRDDIKDRPNQKPFYSLVPLKEILSEIHGVGENSKKVNEAYLNLLHQLGPELEILRNLSLVEIQKAGGEILGEAIRRVREEEIFAQPGFDGEFGKIKVFAPEEDKSIFTEQNTLFGSVDLKFQKKEKREILPFDLATYRQLKKVETPKLDVSTDDEKSKRSDSDSGRDTLQCVSTDEGEPSRQLKQSVHNKNEQHASACCDEKGEKLKSKHEDCCKLKQANTPQPSQGGFMSTSLNPEQRKAVEHFTGPALVLAGPGTGKTRVLTYRIVNLIKNKNVSPENILAITFTNQAAKEMRERLEKMLDREFVSQMTITTFHALGYRILREAFQESEKDFSIIDENDQKVILSKHLGVAKKDLKKALAEITKLKQNPLKLEDFSASSRFGKLHQDSGRNDVIVSDIFKKYNQFLKEHALWDFDDMLYQTVRLLAGRSRMTGSAYSTDRQLKQSVQEECEQPALAGCNKFQWILVDEYQDINAAQYEFLQQLMPEQKANLLAIGDPNQAIYAFRGADIAFIQKFQEDYSQSQIYRLQTSYRCPGNVLQASESVLETEAPLLSLQKGVKVKISENRTDQQEAEFVARKIEEMLGGLRSFSLYSQVSDGNEADEIESLSDFAILCRTRAQMPVFEKAFQQHSLPYQIVGEKSFFQKEFIRNVLDVLKLMENPENVFLRNKLEKQRVIMSDFVLGRDTLQCVSTAIDQFFPKLKTEHPRDFQKLLELAEKFETLPEFLAFASLGKPVDTYDRKVENVSLLTMHASKGLEFKAVFLVGVEDGLMPYSLFENHKTESGEERRLLYVAMTRAQNYLFLSHAQKRFLLGRQYNLSKSPFLTKIKQDLLEQQKNNFKPKTQKEDLQQSLF